MGQPLLHNFGHIEVSLMQLPFLDKKRMAGSISESVSKSEENQELKISEELKVAAEDLISAIHAKDAKKAAMALKAAFLIMESEPHEEAEHD